MSSEKKITVKNVKRSRIGEKMPKENKISKPYSRRSKYPRYTHQEWLAIISASEDIKDQQKEKHQKTFCADFEYYMSMDMKKLKI